MKAAVFLVAMLGFTLVTGRDIAHAQGLRVAPLEYKTTLSKNQVKRGFLDISNPSGQTVRANVSVQAFRQIDDAGTLQFYDDRQVSSGVTVDVSSLELKPKEAYRIFFVVDGAKLPQGDVYGAIFFSTVPAESTTGVGESVRIGTLLSIVNQTPGDRKARILDLNLPFVTFSKELRGSYVIKNDGRAGSGFYPEVTVSTWPFGKTQKKTGSLVFGGRSRTNQLSLEPGYGIRYVSVAYGSSKKGQIVVVVATWHLVVFALLILIISSEILRLRRRRSKQ